MIVTGFTLRGYRLAIGDRNRPSKVEVLCEPNGFVLIRDEVHLSTHDRRQDCLRAGISLLMAERYAGL